MSLGNISKLSQWTTFCSEKKESFFCLWSQWSSPLFVWGYDYTTTTLKLKVLQLLSIVESDSLSDHSWDNQQMLAAVSGECFKFDTAMLAPGSEITDHCCISCQLSCNNQSQLETISASLSLAAEVCYEDHFQFHQLSRVWWGGGSSGAAAVRVGQTPARGHRPRYQHTDWATTQTWEADIEALDFFVAK